VAADEGRAAGAAARLSARLVVGLPLAFLPLAPTQRMFDLAGLVTIAVGAALAGGGMLWIARLVPPLPPSDRTADVAELLAATLRGGPSLTEALDAIADLSPDVLARPRRLRRLGLRWSEALHRSGGEVAELGAAIVVAEREGLPLVDALRVFAMRRRADATRAHRLALRRAPVLMVVPLALCVMPSFLLLAVVPLIRGISVGP
jgi:tight adherence protein B